MAIIRSFANRGWDLVVQNTQGIRQLTADQYRSARQITVQYTLSLLNRCTHSKYEIIQRTALKIKVYLKHEERTSFVSNVYEGTPVQFGTAMSIPMSIGYAIDTFLPRDTIVGFALNSVVKVLTPRFVFKHLIREEVRRSFSMETNQGIEFGVIASAAMQIPVPALVPTICVGNAGYSYVKNRKWQGEFGALNSLQFAAYCLSYSYLGPLGVFAAGTTIKQMRWTYSKWEYITRDTVAFERAVRKKQAIIRYHDKFNRLRGILQRKIESTLPLVLIKEINSFVGRNYIEGYLMNMDQPAL